MFEFGGHNYQKIKTVVYIAQGILVFVAWCITIAFFRSSADTDGRVGWYFGMCFLSIPAIVYETLTPRFPRARKFANPYAFAVVDIFWTILWLSAFASVASFDAAGKCNSSCSLGGVLIALGVFVTLLFGLTSWMSLYGVMYYRRNGTMPGSALPPSADRIDPDKAAFSTAGDDYAPIHGNDLEADHMGPGPNDMYSEHNYDTSYSGYSGSHHGDDHEQHQSDPLNYSGAPVGRVNFPPANYS